MGYRADIIIRVVGKFLLKQGLDSSGSAYPGEGQLSAVYDTQGD